MSRHRLGQTADPGRAADRPLRAVLQAVEDGAASIEEAATWTDLPRDVVSGAIDHLARLGRVSITGLTLGCPAGGCGACPSGSGGSHECRAGGPQVPRRGPVLVTISIP